MNYQNKHRGMRNVRWVGFLLVLCLGLLPSISLAEGVDEREALVTELIGFHKPVKWQTYFRAHAEDALGSLTWTGEGLFPTETFEPQIEVTGMAPEGTKVFVGLFRQEKGQFYLWQRWTESIGATGIFSWQTELPFEGEWLWMVIAENPVHEWTVGKITGKPGECFGLTRTITRKSQELEKTLQNLRVSLYEKEQHD